MTLLDKLSSEVARYEMMTGKKPDTVTMHRDTARDLTEEIGPTIRLARNSFYVSSITSILNMTIICPVSDDVMERGVFELGNRAKAAEPEEIWVGPPEINRGSHRTVITAVPLDPQVEQVIYIAKGFKLYREVLR